ncbi:MAG: A/G-specific adenine glycosylase [Rhodospirillaceae bacterium]
MNFSARLLKWYDANARELPWRVPRGSKARPDPYKVWLSEIMLQQTTVATVRGYFGDFVARWPDVCALAAADLDDVLHAWQGLGYYARARNLHKCARVVAGELAGRFPESEAGLLVLPGVGPYTAAAIAAIAYDLPVTPLDGNIERIVARLYRTATPLPAARPELRALAAGLTPSKRPGDFAQAMMDLGATLCRPKAPDCDACPLRPGCMAAQEGSAERYPLRAAKKPRPTRHGVVYWLQRDDGAVMVRRRPDTGLLGGMMEFPSTPWTDLEPDAQALAEHAPMPVRWRRVAGEVEHVFTHFRLVLGVVEGLAEPGGAGGNARWCRPDEFGALALPTVMKKVARLVSKMRPNGP